MRTVWFHREYTRLRGGHLKHSHYYGHVARMAGFEPRITFTGEPADEPLARERLALWPPGLAGAAVRWAPRSGDVLFVAGVDWRYLAMEGLDDLRNPRINFIQHVRHAHEGTELFGYLAHRAVRICVSQAVADAISATGRVSGPVLAIPNGIENLAGTRRRDDSGFERRSLVVAGYKQPDLARALAGRLAAANVEHLALTDFRPREQYLGLLAGCGVAVCLPRAEEGFYLPALEAMALGCIVVTLDCIGNRGFCRHEWNCLVAEPTVESLAAMTERALKLPDWAREYMLQQARATAAEYSLEAERKRFHAVLADIDRLWRAG